MHGEYANLSDLVLVGSQSGNNYKLIFENCRGQIDFERRPNFEEF